MNVTTLRRATVRAVPEPLQVPLRRLVGRSRPWDPRPRIRLPQLSPAMTAGPPDFVGVGAQKAGTSWWFALILQHPDVYHPDAVHKERHFFTRFWNTPFEDAHVNEYHRWFPRPPGRLTGEWTPEYLVHFWTPPLLRAAAPDARLLVLLRDPVERYRSGLTHYASRGVCEDPRIALEAYLRGCYADQLAWYTRSFPASQMLCLQYEQCRLDPAGQLARTYRFLGLDDSFHPPSLTHRVNATRAQKVPLDEARRAELVAQYRDSVLRLVRIMPDLDLGLWPNFRDVA